MTMLNDVTEPGPFLRPFPDHGDVFGEPSNFHRKHFLPLVSVNLALIEPGADRWLHFVTPIEPLLELDVGTFTEDFHDEKNRHGQVAFRVQENRYSFTGHPHFFAYESGAIFDAFPGQEEEIHADYRRRIETYEASHERFRQTGRLSGPRGESWPFVSQLGGTATGGNWGSEPPRNGRGRPLQFIGEVKAFLYCEGAGFLLLYFDPEEETVLTRIDWT